MATTRAKRAAKTKTAKKKKVTKRKPSLKKLVIDRSKWQCLPEHLYQGAGTLSDCNRMCCLGFAAQACGVPSKALHLQGMPSDLSSYYWPMLPNFLRPETDIASDSRDTKFADSAAKINDSPISVKSKERKLTTLFKKQNVALTFVGKVDR